MIKVGINGFGRIGKTVFIQLLENSNFTICAINAPNLDMKYMKSYLKHDSVHNYNKNFDFEILDQNNFKINNNIVHIFRSRKASELDWKSLGIEYVIDATGAYLTKEKCLEHNSNYVIMCAPPKDKTPLFVYSVNHDKYNGENIVSNASCTTNCITPVLKFLDDKYKINNANFTTIHSTTASQTTVDIVNSNNRTHRSILNNIIPHSTGASSSIFELIPSLTDKVYGTSLRVPVSNVSLVDLNVELEKDVLFNDLMSEFEKDEFIKVNTENLVSTDFITTVYPSIIDKKASMHLGGNRFKIMIWYDNEWSYSAQVIRLVENMYKFNNKLTNCTNLTNTNQYFIDNYNFKDVNVVVRVDWNIPTTSDYKITDDYRIRSSLLTINRILKDVPNRLIIISHFGRPKGITEKYSFKHYLEQIQSYFDEKITFLEHGLTEKTLDELNEKINTSNNTSNKLFLLENVRFHDEETNYTSDKYKNTDCNEAINVINKLGDFFVNDAFGCMHRDHLSICGIKLQDKAYGYLVNKELEALSILMENKENKKILAIIGGAKVDDKLPLLESLSQKMNDIYIAGGNINGIIKNNMWSYIEKISKNKANVHIMNDGVYSNSLTDKSCHHCYVKDLPCDAYFYDMGMESIIKLNKLINENDIIFWNGTLGVVEDEKYEYSSRVLINLLMKSGKKVIIGGGDTAGYANKFEHNFYFISTGGGAVIEYISEGSLVGVNYFMK